MTTRRRFSQVTETLACRHPKALVSACAILPGNIGAGLPSSEQTPLPKASVHAVARQSVHDTAPVIRLIRPHNLWLLWACAFPATRHSQPVSLWLLVTRRRCFSDQQGHSSPQQHWQLLSQRVSGGKCSFMCESGEREIIYSEFQK